MRLLRGLFMVLISGFMALSGGIGCARAETIAIAQEYGISYLPLTIMRVQDLLGKAGKAEGIDITTNGLTFTGGAPMNEALISGKPRYRIGWRCPHAGVVGSHTW